ncbi:DUF1822 family protein [Pseudanabaena galeata UHCC 0370]|uniref:DUF1822 family protein n=1 Tax=Pseudanabaena galeata UHCC 0370 TaxID=3110310 RepID=A0ABU5TES8_9CYAN|nr:DUF1822 family protein [Pseudanabaena galeata]MEA5476756.1 DUF1822 family protein [Pseudanabaena galeata UHCC 0370]
MNALINEFETLDNDAIALSSSSLQTAANLSELVTTRSQQWQAYFNSLALFGFETWLQERAPDVRLERDNASVFEPNQAGAIAATYGITVNQFRVCLIPIDSEPDTAISLSRILIESVEFRPHFYVLVELYEEQEQAIIKGWLRADNLIARQSELSLSTDWKYEIPLAWFDHDCDDLLLYWRCASPAMIDLPSLAPTIAGDRYSWLQLLTQPAIDTAQWFQEEWQALVNDLAWVLLPTVASASGLRSSGATLNRSPLSELETILTAIERTGMRLPSNARAAYQDFALGEYPLRLYAVIGSEQENDGAIAWSLLTILGKATDRDLPVDLILRISDITGVLVERQLEAQGAYLFAEVEGTPEERFLVTAALADGTTRSLPPFAFQAE